MKNEIKRRKYGRIFSWLVVVLSLVLLFGGPNFSLTYGSTALLDSNSIIAIILLILGIMSFK